MEQSAQISDFLPTDNELLHREKVFLSLFDKYNVDEGSDPELIEDFNMSTESSDSGSSFSEASGCETEDNFDAEEMHKQLQPLVTERVNGWAEKGINFQLLKSVDSAVTVEEWLEANQEFTTTTKKYKKTVINEQNKTTTTTTTQTKTTTMRTTFNMRRNNAPFTQTRATTSGDLVDGEPSRDRPDIEAKMDTQTEQTYWPNDVKNSKIFDIPRGRRKHSKPDRLNLTRKATSPKVKRLLPQKMKLRNRKQSIAAKSGSKRTQSGSEIFSTGVSNGVSNEVSNEVFGDGAVGYDDESLFENDTPEQTQSDRSQEEKEASHCSISSGLSKSRPPNIVVYSPSAGKKFGTRIDDEFMSVSKRDFKQGIHQKYHQYTDFSFIKKCIVPVSQKLIYEPPMDVAMEKNLNNDDSETDDDLLTSYLSTGHFHRTNSK